MRPADWRGRVALTFVCALGCLAAPFHGQVMSDEPVARIPVPIFQDDFETGSITRWSDWVAGACFEIALDPSLTSAGAIHQTEITWPSFGGPEVDIFVLEFNSSDTGTFDLQGDNYSTCDQCLLAYVDNGAGTIFFQDSGTLTVHAGSQPLSSVLDATLLDVTLVEVTIDPGSYVSNPVPGGDCLHIVSANLVTSE